MRISRDAKKMPSNNMPVPTRNNPSANIPTTPALSATDRAIANIVEIKTAIALWANNAAF